MKALPSLLWLCCFFVLFLDGEKGRLNILNKLCKVSQQNRMNWIFPNYMVVTVGDYDFTLCLYSLQIHVWFNLFMKN